MEKKSGKQEYDGVVVCSTNNQMVNYLTILEHFGSTKTIEMFNLTFGNGYSKFPNSEWDKNLKNCLDKYYTVNIIPIEYKEKEISSHKKIMKHIKKEIDKSKCKKLLWNITGGQRHLVMAITEYVFHERPDDVIVFLDGNQNKFYYYSKIEELESHPISDFGYDKLNLTIAFTLMGFTQNDTMQANKYYDYVFSDKDTSNIKEEEVFYNEFYNEFIKSSKNLKLLNILHKNNKILEKAKTETEDKNGINKKNPKKRKLEVLINELKNDRMLSNLLTDNNTQIFIKSLDNVANAMVFGYLFEKMVFYKIINCLKNSNYLNKIADIYHGAKLMFEHVNNEKLGLIDEFDILILTKSGQVIAFECKSGHVSGDHVKSHHYSTYALSGVYGTPILLTPLTENMRPGNGEDSKLYDKLRLHRQKADRAKVDFWFFDKLEEKLKTLF